MNLKQNLIIILAVIIIGVCFIIYGKVTDKKTVTEPKNQTQIINDYLANKYNEDFSELKFIKSANKSKENSYSLNQDEEIINYYVATSQKDNIDITIYFKENTQDFNDTYKLEQEELKKGVAFFDLLSSKFASVLNYYTIKENYHQLNLVKTTSKEELEKGLKTIYDCPVNYINNRNLEFIINIKQNAYLFSKNYYNDLNLIYNFIHKNSTDNITFSFKFLTLDNVEIKYDSKTDQILVNDLNDYFSNMARDEQLLTFIQRNFYQIKQKTR